MTDAEKAKLAAETDRLIEALAPIVRDADHLPAALALTRLAAEHVYHDDADEEDFMNVCRAAWGSVAAAHRSGGCSH